MTMKTLAVIPARSGSTRLKNKNIYPLCGKPLIRWITEAVVQSNCFDDILISTNSDKIFTAVEDLAVKRHNRRDHVSTEATVLDAMIQLMQDTKNTYDAFAYFLPTCPFIAPEDIISGYQVLTESNCDSVVSMTIIPETIQLACIMSDNNVLPIFDNIQCGMTNSKFIKKYYKPSGGFYMAKWSYLLEKKNFFKGITKGVVIPAERSVDINTIEDIHYAELLKGTK